MKRKVIVISVAFTIILIGLLALSSVLKGRAESISEDFQISGKTLMKYYGNDELCILPSNIETVASAAFEGNESIKRLVLPSSLQTIEYNAFAEMPNLERVVLPDSVTKIGSSCFANCENLSSFYIGKNLTQIGACPFAGCNKLDEIEVNSNNVSFTCIDGVLYSADRKIIYEMLPGRQKSFYVFPDSVMSISPYAFWGCDKLNYITASDSLITFPAYAFSSASGLKSVALSFNTKEICMKAFENCTSLEQIYIPDSMEKIHPSAFDGCNRLSLYANAGSPGEKYATENNIKIIYSPKYDLDIATIERENYAENKYQESLKEKQEILYNPADDKDSMGSTFIVNNEAVVLMDPGIMEIYSGENNTNPGFDQILSDNVKDGKIPDNLFYLKNELDEILIPSNVKTVGKFAFSRSGLESVIIPEGVETIEFGAFYHCDELSDVSIPSSVKVIESKAFDKTKWLNNWYESSEDDYLIVGDGILLAYKGSKEDFVMPDNVKYVSCDIE